MKLRDYLGQRVIVTYRDGKEGVGVFRKADSQFYPFKIVSSTSSGARNNSYTESGKVLMFGTNDEDIVSIEPLNPDHKMQNSINLEQYVGHQVRLTFRDQTHVEGSLSYSSEDVNWPYLFIPSDENGDWETYTECDRVHMLDKNSKDIMSIEILQVTSEPKPDSAIDKMALGLLPAIFTSVESDPNLEEALESAIRGAFLAMFGNDVSGQTLDRMVQTVKSQISYSVK